MSKNSIPSLSPAELTDADEQIGIVHLVCGKTGAGEDFYAYISVKPSRYEEFMLIMSAGHEMNLEEFGDILKKGFGADPSPQVMKMMEDKYGIDHQMIQKLIAGQS